MAASSWPYIPAWIPDRGLWLSLGQIALLLCRSAFAQRLLGADPQDPYRGLLLSDEEVDALLKALVEQPECPSHPVLSQMECTAEALDPEIERELQEPSSRLGTLVAHLGLDALEREILVLALLPEVEPRYGRLMAFLQDDVTKARPTPFLALRLLGRRGEEGAVWRSLLPDSRLRAHRLIRLEAPSHEPSAPFVQHALIADPRIVQYLLAGPGGEEAPFPFLRRVKPGRPLEEILFPSSLKECLAALLEPLAMGAVSLLLLEGPAGCGRRTVARALASAMGRPLLELERPQGDDASVSAEDAVLAAREACLQGAILLAQEGSGLPLVLWAQLGRSYGVPICLASEALLVAPRLPEGTVRLVLERPDAQLRVALWERFLAGRPCEGVSLYELASRYRLLGGHIRDAAAWAQGRAYLHRRTAIAPEDLEEAVSVVVMPTLDDLARPVPARHRWEELILPEDARAHLRELAAAIRRRDLVYDAWGFDRQRPMGKGLNALFAGPSGTGKTMAAKIIAGELGLPLFKIDLSAVVSKYVGETEKHLRRLFAEAERANAILFFDEADALFGKRSEVSDAHDRYANIEVAYLLQALEEHAGVCILATNLFGNMDDAFVRRMHFVVHFPFPDEPARRRIWQVIFPAQAPLGNDVDPGELARRFRVTGGHIRNIALGAAFLAAEDGQVITMGHLLQAARREFQKMGKVIDEADFG
ncbi:MAG: AAA family ATPase [Chloroflexia bacterium]